MLIVVPAVLSPREAATCAAALEAADWRPKTALVSILARVDAATAENALIKSDGRARDAVARLEGEQR